MNPKEEAAITYNPNADAALASSTRALKQAERQLAGQTGVEGMGITKRAGGEDAIVVYVENAQALARLPEYIDGVAVIGEITGKIRPY